MTPKWRYGLIAATTVVLIVLYQNALDETDWEKELEAREFTFQFPNDDYYLREFLQPSLADIKKSKQSRTNKLKCAVQKLAQDNTGYHDLFPFDGVMYSKQHTYKRWKVIPFAVGFRNIKSSQHISIVTQFTIERLDRLKAYMSPHRWPSRVSAALFVRNEADADWATQHINSTWPNSLLARLDLHVVIELPGQGPDTVRGSYPINVLRNVAWNYVRTPFVFLVDVDFLPSLNMLDNIPYQVYKSQYKKIAWVVAPFWMNCNTTTELQVEDTPYTFHLQNEVLVCQTGAPVGYGSSKGTYIQYWYNATVPYRVAYRFDYEPYVIVPTHTTPRYEEAYGYHADKVMHLFEIAAAGYQFVVLPKVFVEHLPHPSKELASVNIWEKICNTAARVRCKYGMDFGLCY